MKLSAETFYQLLASLQAGACCGLDEMRHEPRVEAIGHAKISCHSSDGDSESFAVGVRNLSRSGIGLIHFQPLAVGQDLLLHLPTDENPDHFISYRIVRCSRLGAKLFSIGARLIAEAVKQAA